MIINNYNSFSIDTLIELCVTTFYGKYYKGIARPEVYMSLDTHTGMLGHYDLKDPKIIINIANVRRYIAAIYGELDILRNINISRFFSVLFSVLLHEMIHSTQNIDPYEYMNNSEYRKTIELQADELFERFLVETNYFMEINEKFTSMCGWSLNYKYVKNCGHRTSQTIDLY